MAHRDALNEIQLNVLRWIADGCEEGVYDDYTHRVSAAALKRRGLVAVTGRGATWTATATNEGQRYLDRVDSSTSPTPRQGGESVTQRLVDDVIAAGGTATFPRPRVGIGEVDYARRAALAHVHGKVPAGQQLVVTHRGNSIEISLIDGPTADSPPVPVPDKVGRLHPIARAFRDDRSRHEIARAQLGRATRIVHALVTEAERRGHQATLSNPKSRTHGSARWSGPADGHLLIRTESYEARLRLREDGLGSRAYFEQNKRNYVRTPDGRLEQLNRKLDDYEAKASGRLRVELIGYGGRSGRYAHWADRKSWRLEDKLGDVLWEIEARDADERRAQANAAIEAERQERLWQDAMDEARAAVVEQQRGDALRAQVTAWHDASQIRAWCDAASDLHPDDSDMTAWVEWARDYATRIDSQATPPRAPEAEPIAADDLRPFLDGWSPYGPKR